MVECLIGVGERHRFSEKTLIFVCVLCCIQFDFEYNY